MCITPLTLKRPREEWQTDKNTHSTTTRVVPCGKCYQCLRARQNAWVFRLTQESKVSETTAFITLTYAEETLSFNGHGTLVPSHLTNFWKRLRKQLPTHKIKYFAVGEYGTKFKRPHYHAIVYNIPFNLLQNPEKIAKIWTHGSIDIGEANGASMRYTISYIMEQRWQPEQDDDDRHKQFQRQSKNLGINYLTPQIKRYHKENKIPVITQSGGQLLTLPRYYKEKIFEPHERKAMAWEAEQLHALDLDTLISKYSELQLHEKVENKIRQHNKQQTLKTKKL